ncbi:MAG: hypothetical protein ABIG70_09870 [Pseudomonadota bacterium]
MADYTQKLANMRNRRTSLDSGGIAAMSAAFREATLLTESYEQRGKTGAIKYALGAMQQLEPKYTEISISEGERVRNQLETGLRNASIPATFDYQGSVPLNIHIRFSSDIDLLALHDRFVTFDSTSRYAGGYTPKLINPLVEVWKLRQQCESILDLKFPTAKVDKSGAKSISLSGGSLQRKVDVVPSHWHDTAAYQCSQQKHDREVRILDKDAPALLANRPFLHMKHIEEKDKLTVGGTKKAIRLLKNLKRDSSRDIGLTSYDIAALIWHCNNTTLTVPSYLELSLIAAIQNYLQYLADNPNFAFSLDVPDLSRKIFDSLEKFQALKLLKAEVDQLAIDIFTELKPYSFSTRDLVHKSLMEAEV